MSESWARRRQRSFCNLTAACLVLVLGWTVAKADPLPPASSGTSTVKHGPNTFQAGPPRFAIHDGFDRLVVMLPAEAIVESHREGDVLVLHLDGFGQASVSKVAGRRMRGVIGGPDELRFILTAGSRPRIWRTSNRLVLDVLDALPPDTLTSRNVSSPSLAARASSPGPSIGSVGSRVLARPVVPVTEPNADLVKIGGVAWPVRLDRKVGGLEKSLPSPKEVAVPQKSVGQTATPQDTAASTRIDAAVNRVPIDVASTSNVSSLGTQPPSTTNAAVMLLPEDPGMPGPAIFLPLPPEFGSASYVRGNEAHVVIDVPRSWDLSALKDNPVFGNVTEQLLADGMQMRFRLAVGMQLKLARRPNGLVITIVSANSLLPPLKPIIGRKQATHIDFGADHPGRVVVLDDETTGGRLLIGTQRSSGQHVGSSHVGAEFSLLPTWQGLVVEPASDRLLLNTTDRGFELSETAGTAFPLAWPDQGSGSGPDGRAMTRVFDLPNLPTDRLARRLGQALRDAALAPKQNRFQPRLRVAQAMLTQGMDLEAAAVLRTALSDDPARRDDDKAAGLAAIAVWLSARAGGAPSAVSAFDPARLGNSDEARLWRALLSSKLGDDPIAADLAAVWPLLLDYPSGLRKLMLAPVAASLAKGKQDVALDSFLAAFPEVSLDFSRAQRLCAQAKLDDCLALLARIAARPDRLERAEALDQSVQVRLKAGRLTPIAAAEELGRQLYAWRGGDRELRQRQQIAALQTAAGAWRDAIGTLRATELNFPQAHDQIHHAEVATLADLLHGGHAAKLDALQLVTLADETADLLTEVDGAGGLAPVLAAKLLALELPDRAEPIIKRLFENASQPADKADIGLHLAELAVDRNDPAAALAVLDASPDGDLGLQLVSARTLLRAKALAASGRQTEAERVLSGQTGPTARETLADLLEKQRDWPGAAAALELLRQGSDSASLSVDDRRQLILRLARDESQAGNLAALRQLRVEEASRFQSGPDAELFSLLTAEPIKSEADLARSARDLTTIRTLPLSLAHARPM